MGQAFFWAHDGNANSTGSWQGVRTRRREGWNERITTYNELLNRTILSGASPRADKNAYCPEGPKCQKK
jgi:hypothetical protein